MKCKVMFERPYPHTPAGQMFKEYSGELGSDGILWVERAGAHAVKGKWGIHVASKAVIVPEGEAVVRGIAVAPRPVKSKPIAAPVTKGAA